MYKKIILFIFSVVLLASCGVRKQTVSPISKSDGVQTDILNYGMKYLNKPYRYAGKGPNSFDCSGFTSFIFKEFGYRLSTSSAGQAKQVPSINRREDLRVGDLVFFEGRAQNKRVGHVGIVKEILPNGNFLFLHSSTSYGVIVSRSTEPYYASRYLHGGRVLKENNQVVLANKASKSADKPSPNGEIVRVKKNKNETKEPVIVKAPKTKTEQELDISLNTDKQNHISKKDSVIIHTRHIGLPIYADSKSNNKDNEHEATISKQALRGRSNNRSVPKPIASGGDGKDPIQYKVMPGDTLYSISQKHSCSVDNIRQWNPQLGNTLKAGETISIFQ